MSIRLGTGNSGANECLFNGTSSAMGIGTGDFSFGAWHYVTGTGGTNDIMSLQANVPPDASSGDMITTYCNSSEVLALYTSNTGQVGTPTSIAAYIGTWVYIVVSRSGSTLSCKVYDDSSSTTPLVTISGTESGSFSCNYMVLGNNFNAELGYGDYRSAKLVIGDAWTDSEARAESASVLPTTGAGTVWGCWDLGDVTTGGLKDLSGNGRDLTNNSSYGVTQANDPTYLTSEVPLIQETNRGGSGSGTATSQTVTMPTTKSGKLICVVTASDGGLTFTIPAGWTKIGSDQDSTAHTSVFFYRDLDNTEGTSISVSHDGSACEMSWAWIRVTGAATGAPDSAVTNSGASASNPDPPSLSPAGGANDYLWLPLVGTDGVAQRTLTAPTSYLLEEIYDYQTQSQSSATVAAIASRYLNATTENPGTFTFSPSTDEWAAATVAVATGTAGRTGNGAVTLGALTTSASGTVSGGPQTEALYPDVLITQTGLTGAVTAIDEDPDSPDGNWLTTSNNTNTVCQVSFPSPSGDLTAGAGLQEFRILLRKTNHSTDPTFAVDLYENGSLVSNLASGVTLSTTTGQVYSYTWNASSLAAISGVNVEVRITGTVGGGGPSNRASVEVGAIEWNATYDSNAVTGNGAVTLGALTTTATGDVPRTGNGAVTLGAITTTASGVTTTFGTGAVTLGAITTTASGTVADATITGTGAVTLGAITTAATGVTTTFGTGAVTLGALTTTATGDVPRTGNGAVTLGALTTAATGVTKTFGDAAVTLGAITTTASGTVAWEPRTGTGAVTLGALTTTASGVTTTFGDGAVTLGALTVASTGVTKTFGDAALTLGALTTTSSGTVAWEPRTGTGAVTLGALAVASTGVTTTFGTGAVTLGAITVAATGVTTTLGDSAVTLGAITVTAAGAVQVQGDGAVTLGALGAAATGDVPILGTGAITLGALTTTATGDVPRTGTGAITLGALSATGTGAGVQQAIGNGAITLGALTTAATGVTKTFGTGAITLGALGAAATGDVPIFGDGAITLGALGAAATGQVAIQGPAVFTFGSLATSGSGKVLVQGGGAVSFAALGTSAAGDVPRVGTGSFTLGVLQTYGYDEGDVTGPEAYSNNGITTSVGIIL